jgi:hypothetical protein
MLNRNLIITFFGDAVAPIVPDNQENEKLCTCPGCPTYLSSHFKGNVYCARGKASEKVSATGCNCPSCPVATKYGLDLTYYCVSGKS